MQPYRHPQGRNAKGNRKRMEREIKNKKTERVKEGSGEGRDKERGAWQEARGA